MVSGNHTVLILFYVMSEIVFDAMSGVKKLTNLMRMQSLAKFRHKNAKYLSIILMKRPANLIRPDSHMRPDSHIDIEERIKHYVSTWS